LDSRKTLCKPDLDAAAKHMTIQSITKFEAATRLLREAIRLYFLDAEPLGVHTVAGAAHGLLRDLLRRRKSAESGHSKGGTVQQVHVAFVTKMVEHAKNFLKHADRDPTSVLRFNSNWTDFLVYDAIVIHIELARDLTRENIIFLLWVTAKYPKVLLFENLVANGNLSADDIDELRRVFPKLGAVDAQKRAFLAALNSKSPHVH
jgi:hypothetical protein